MRIAGRIRVFHFNLQVRRVLYFRELGPNATAHSET